MIQRYHDLPPDLDPSEAGALAIVGDHLRHGRPVPGAAFRGDLRRLLIAGAAEPAPRAPAHLWAWAGASWAGGLALMAFAVLSVAGSGPLAT